MIKKSCFKLLSLFALLSLALTACTPAPVTTPPTEVTTPVETTPPSTEQTPPAQTSKLTSYRNDTYGVSFTYPKAWTISEADDPFVTLSMPADAYAGTNFEQAHFSMSATSSDSLDACLSAQPNGAMAEFDQNEPLVFNNNTYYMVNGGDSGMGHWGSLKFYRTYQHQMCFTVEEELVVTSTAPEYHPTPYTEVDSDAVWARLDAILQTVGFDS